VATDADPRQRRPGPGRLRLRCPGRVWLLRLLCHDGSSQQCRRRRLADGHDGSLGYHRGDWRCVWLACALGLPGAVLPRALLHGHLWLLNPRPLCRSVDALYKHAKRQCAHAALLPLICFPFWYNHPPSSFSPLSEYLSVFFLL